MAQNEILRKEAENISDYSLIPLLYEQHYSLLKEIKQLEKSLEI
jgi:hypothetical protein